MTLQINNGWSDLFDGVERERLERQVLPRFLPAQRWFGGKSRVIHAVTITDWASLDDADAALLLIDVHYDDAGRESYFVPLAITFDPSLVLPVGSVLAEVAGVDGPGRLFDATYDDRACDALLALIELERDVPTRHGYTRGSRGSGFTAARGVEATPLVPVRGTAEQSNTSVRFGDRLILKLFRRQEAGPNPDCEVNQYLSDHARFSRVPPFAGVLDYVRSGTEPAALGLLQAVVSNQGDGWTWALEELDRYYETSSPLVFAASDGSGQHLLTLAAAPDTDAAREHLGIALDAAAVLGRRTGELHLALAEANDPAFAHEPLTGTGLLWLGTALRDHGGRVFARLRRDLSELPDELVESAALVLGRRRTLLDRFDAVKRLTRPAGWSIRVHGDYHLGQVLRAKGDFYILDFEGEPARPLPDRRARHSPLKDVAGMIRSFDYAAWTSLLTCTTRRPDDRPRLEPWARLWAHSTSASFLRAYRASVAGAPFVPDDEMTWRVLLDAYVLDKVLYELAYELDNRPAWVRVPLNGILGLEGM